MSETIEHLTVGTRVRIEEGFHTGEETVITELIPDLQGKDEDMRYDVACAKGRWYYRDELTVVVPEKANEQA